MSDNPIIGIKEQQRRRRRINRMKTTLIWILAGWMVLSFIAVIVLSCQVFSLNKRFNHLYEYITSSSGNTVVEEAQDSDLVEIGDNFEDAPTIFDTEESTQNGEKRVYLTFDDGPSENTGEILDILKEKDVKATFFVVGRTDEKSKALYKRIVDEGHTIGLHSYSHKYSKIYSSLENYQLDLAKLDNLVYETTGFRTKFIRFPGGSSNKVSDVDMNDFIELVTQKGYVYFDWNVANGDATSNKYSPAELRKNVLKGVKYHNQSVVLMHDASNKNSTVESLPKLIDSLRKDGYELLPIDENTKPVQHVSVDSVVND
ncbi:MAG: polysaccharide deacetylase [Lachnospiraceae bacterium]|nr:polysaccharide deacetylase [Lachnospiraceae bacterium]